MATDWYVRIGNVERGPIASETLKHLALEGKVTPETPVRKGDSGNWVPANRVKGLFVSHVDHPVPPPPPVSVPMPAGAPQVRPTPMPEVVPPLPQSAVSAAVEESTPIRYAPLDTYHKALLGVGAACLAVLAVSPFLNWVNILGGGILGIEGDGKIILILSLCVAGGLVTELVINKRSVTSVFLAQALGTIACLWMVGEVWRVRGIRESPEIADNLFGRMLAIQVSPGAGLILGMLGGIGMAIAFGLVAIHCLKKTRLFVFTQALSLLLGLGIAAVLAHQGSSPVERKRDALAASQTGQKEHKASNLGDATARDGLKKFVVNKARFYYDKDSFIEKPIIELSVTNKTPFPLSRAYFRAILTSPGRSIPWVEGDFNYSIPGGLERNESATWQLAPNMFGEWRNAPRDRSDTVLTVTPIRLDGTDGTPLYDSR